MTDISEHGIARCSPGDALIEVTQMLVKVIGPDFICEDDVHMDSSFSEDLCLESIQFVVLAEELRARYGAKMNFAAWLAGMDLDQIIELRVSDLVELIVTSVNGASDG